MCLLKRVLPFALALTIGVMLWAVFSHGSLTHSDRVFSPKDVTQKARIFSRAQPRYTEEARNNQISGTVVLRAVFADDGLVKNIRVVSGLPYGLTEQAVEAARQIKFSPAVKDGQAVSQYIQIEYNFNLY